MMIRQLFIINIKAMFAAMFTRSRARVKASGKRRFLTGKAGVIAAILLAVYCIGAFGLMFFGLFMSVRDIFIQLDIAWLYFAVAGVLVFTMCTITCIFTAQSQIFNAKDNELLLSFPIRPSSILLARILTLLVVEYAFEALITIPALLVWLLGGYGSALGIVFFVVGFVLLPLLALAVACLLAWIITLITARMRRKNIATLVVSVGFLIAYFMFFGNMQSNIQKLMENGAEIAAAFRRGFPPVYFYGNALANGAPLDALLFALCCVIPFAAIIALLSANFIKVATTKRGAKRIVYSEKAVKTSTALRALTRRELAHYASNPMFILNMTMGSLMMVLAGGFALVKRDMVTELMAQLSQMVPGLTPGLLIGAALAFCATTNCASASLISIEGRTLWIARSMPVRSRDSMLAKLLMHAHIGVWPGVLASLLGVIALKPSSITDMLIAFLLPILFTILMGTGGLALNILLPKFNWVNEVQPVKQGLPVMLLMFGSMALVFVLVLPYALLLKNMMSVSAYIWLVLTVIAAVCALLYHWIMTSGARRYDAYEI